MYAIFQFNLKKLKIRVGGDKKWS